MARSRDELGGAAEARSRGERGGAAMARSRGERGGAVAARFGSAGTVRSIPRGYVPASGPAYRPWRLGPARDPGRGPAGWAHLWRRDRAAVRATVG